MLHLRRDSRVRFENQGINRKKKKEVKYTSEKRVRYTFGKKGSKTLQLFECLTLNDAEFFRIQECWVVTAGEAPYEWTQPWTQGQTPRSCNNDAERRERARPYHQRTQNTLTQKHKCLPGDSTLAVHPNLCRCRKTVMRESQPAFWIRIASSDTTSTVKLSWSPQTTWLTHLGTCTTSVLGFSPPPPSLWVQLPSGPHWTLSLASQKKTHHTAKRLPLPHRKWLDFLN